MVDTVFNLDLYKIPSEEILRNRRAFYSLWRRSDDETKPWLTRVQSCIRRCEFPTIIMEFLLLDRFICGLTADELESIQNASQCWTLKQLLEYFSDGNIDIEHVVADSAVDGNVHHSENISLDLVKVEPNGEELIQINQSSEWTDEDNAVVKIETNVIEEEFLFDNNSKEATNSHFAIDDEEEIDDEMLNDAMQFECEDYKFSVADAVPIGQIDEENRKSLLDEQNENKRNTSERPHACDECDKSFTTSSILSKHKKFVHRGIRSYVCNECGKCFQRAQHLKQHSVIHTGKRPFACDQCDKAFTQSSQLKVHKMMVHEGIRLHACEQCNKHFGTAANLKTHSRTHTGERPYACDECDKSFTQSGSLSTHKKSVHLGIRPHVCNKCDKSFFTSADLRRHLRIHTGERSYTCDKCDKSFNQLIHLKIHKRKVHQKIDPHAHEELLDKHFTTAH